ncbi:MAG: PAS domain S-box protein [Gemmatimonadetes bacterium]|nr:MAG: PAS domain S-box protein [Gemmatimonadota bacterium]
MPEVPSPSTTELRAQIERLERENQQLRQHAPPEAVAHLLEKVENAKREWEVTVDVLSELICLINSDGEIQRANRTVERWQLGQVMTIKGQNLLELLHPEPDASKAAFEAFWKKGWQRLAKGQSARGEYFNTALQRHLSIHLLPLTKENPLEPVAIVIKDVTEQRRAEEALASEREMLDVTLHSIGDGVITTDVDGRIALFNQIAEKLTGWKEYEALGRSLNEVFLIYDEDTREPCENPVQKTLKANTAISYPNHVILVSRDQKEYGILLSGSPLHNTKGEMMGVVITFQDVTEMRRLERSKFSFLNSISHELRTPLTSILGFSDLLLYNANPEDYQEYVNQIRKSAERQSNLVEALLTIVKLESDAEEYQLETVDAYPLLEEILVYGSEFIEIMLHERHPNRIPSFNYHYTLPEELRPIKIRVDENRIQKVIENLLSNAVKYSSIENISIHVEVRLQDGYLEIHIQDQGRGIPPEEMEHIFKPFYQVRERRYDVSDGIGCGLTMVNRHVRAHGGHIRVESTVGEGSHFTIILPVKSES